jgi:hypothetical protein
MQLLLAVLFLLSAAGCSGPKPAFYWYHPDRTFAEAKVDYAECESQAQDEAAKVVEEKYFDRLRSPDVLAGDEKAQDKIEKSDDPELQAKANWAAVYKQKAFAGCMQSRGYVQLRPHQISPRLKTKELPLGAIAGRNKAR